MPIKFPEYESFDGLGLADLIKRKVLSPQEVLEAAIERIELRNPDLNAVIHKMYDQARATSKKETLAGPFAGVPILLKDVLAECAGEPIYFGSQFAYNNHWTSKEDSEQVKRFKASGAVIVGKTNLPEFGLSPVTEPELFGATKNPWNLEYSPGGSSGGSAAAVASRMVPIAHGGDGGGSIRIPAAFTGTFGFKPTRGRTPTGPQLMRVWLGCVVEHVLSRTVRDSAAMLDVLSGPELGSTISLPKPEHSFSSELTKPLRSLRIGLIEDPFFSANVNPEYLHAVKKAGELCQSLGHQVEVTKLKINEEVAFAFLTLILAETSAALRVFSQKVGRKPKLDELEKITAMLCHAGEEFSAADYAWAVYTLDMAGLELAKFFEKYDVMLTATVPTSAPKLGEFKPHGRELVGVEVLRFLPYGHKLRQFIQRMAAKKFSMMAFTALFNIGGQPAMSVPLYWDKNNMPIGIQFGAKAGADALLLQLAQQLENAQPWIDKQPIGQ